MIPWLRSNSPFPDVSTALTEEDGAAGLLAAGADLSPDRLLMAYRLWHLSLVSEGNPSFGGAQIRAWCCIATNSSFRTV